MPIREEFYKGQVVGKYGAIFVKDVDPYISPSGRKCRKAIFIRSDK